MVKNGKLRRNVWLAALTLCLMAGMFFHKDNTVFSRAEASGVVKTKSATIRKEPDTNSEVMASILANDKVDIAAQTTGPDGYTWYKVYVNGSTLGYVRSDLIDKTGDVPSETYTGTAGGETVQAEAAEEGAAGEGGAAADPGAAPAMAEGVTASTVATAKVTASTVRVRQEASTNSGVAGNAVNGTVVNIVGEITDGNAKVWYQVSFEKDGKTVNGFIRSDFLEPQDMVPEPAPEETPEEEQAEPEPEQTQKEYDTILEPDAEGLDTWYLYHYATDGSGTTRVKIPELMGAQDTISTLSTDYQSLQKTFKIALIAAIALVVILIVALIILFIKLREASYEYEEDEDEYDDEDDYEDDYDDEEDYEEDEEYEDEDEEIEEEDDEEEEVVVRKRRPARQSGRKRYEDEEDEEDYDDEDDEEELYERRPRRPAPKAGKRREAAPARASKEDVRYRSMTPGGKTPISTKPKKPLRKEEEEEDFPYDQEVIYQGEGRRSSRKEDKNWQSKNFLDIDDEFEFEFLDLK